jgi:hypothetical protein
MMALLNLIRSLKLMSMVAGMLLVVDGLPLIFFFKETLRLAPGSTVFTAAVMLFGFVLMIPASFLRKLYRYNSLLMPLAITSLTVMISYMFLEGAATGNDIIYYAYIFIFLFLLLNVPNDIIEVAIPVIVLFTLVSNLALVYALLHDPTWILGQRASIQYGAGVDRTGNPHPFSRNALMGIIACVIWLTRPKLNAFLQLFAFFCLVFSGVILLLTAVRSSILAFVLMSMLFMFYNVRPAQIRSFVRGLFRPLPLLVMGLGVLGVMYFFQRYSQVYSLLYGYAVNFLDRNLENVYALLGMKAQGVAYAATLDDSSVNRTVSTNLISMVLEAHIGGLLIGYGYKFMYLDVPVLEMLLNHGFIGFIPYASFIGLITYFSLRAMRRNYNPFSTFLAYFWIYFLVTQFTNGRPYEISHWHPLCLMIRFLGVEELVPARLWSSPWLATIFHPTTTTNTTEPVGAAVTQPV